MDLLFLCHCVPNPPDKGEKIRAHQEVLRLGRRHRVHLVCFARSAAEGEAARALESICASVHATPLFFPAALARAFGRFALGGCLTTSLYGSGAVRRRVAEIASAAPLSAAVVFSSAMAQYAPAGLPLVLDMVDVDSEKWFQYGAERFPGFVYRTEGRRLRRIEAAASRVARRSILATRKEEALLRSFAGGAATAAMENGVDLDYFDPERSPSLGALEGRKGLAFVGAMDYYPNAAAAVRFAADVFPALRALDPELEFWIVGRNPDRAVRRLARLPGVTVTGSVPDVRPYLKAARLAVAPLGIARGIQNKVLEALAMGKPVLASPAVCETFGEAPAGVIRCASTADYVAAAGARADASIREAARVRFSWQNNLGLLEEEVLAAEAANF
jgi:sugar transferase (PEP-CTERM/EpsH1 system associated)